MKTPVIYVVEINLVPEREREREQHGVKFSIRIKFLPPPAKLGNCPNYNANILKRKTRISQLAVET
jgi:hypothetical protein